MAKLGALLLGLGLLLGGPAAAQVTPATVQAGINAVPWTNGSGKVTGATLQAQFQAFHDLINGMGTWTGSQYAVGISPANSGSAPGGFCDTSVWIGYIGGTQAPQFACAASYVAPGTITIPFAAVVGIGNATGGQVPVGDKTFEQFAQLLVQGQTAMDNNHQEDMVTFNMISGTGGGSLPQTNHNQKVALYIPVLAIPGASNTWAINDDLTINSGVGNYSFYRHEGDMTNFNGNYQPGGCPIVSGVVTCPAGQINGNAFGDFMTFSGFPVTAAMDFTGNPNSGSASLHYGLLFQGATGTNIGQGLIDIATINDSTNSPVIIKAYSNHTAVIDTLNGAVARIWQSQVGQLGCFFGGDDCLGDVSSHVMRFTSNGGATLQLAATNANAYNGLQVTAAGAGFGPLLAPFSLDSETNLPLTLRSLGTGSVTVSTGNGQVLSMLDAGGTVANYATVQSASTGFGPIISAVGTDTNVLLNLRGKGSSPVQVLGGFAVSGGMSAPGLVTAAGTVKGSLCVDTTGVVYVKTTTGACL